MSTAVATRNAHEVKLFEEFTDEARYNIIRPTESVYLPSPLHTVYANVVKFSPDDTYPVDGGRLALNGRALARIAAAAGISILNVARHDDGSNPDYAEVSVLAVMRRPDGSPIHATGKKAMDVNAYIGQQIASQKAKTGDKRKSDQQIMADAERDRLQLRKFRVERAETGAKNRAIRQLLAMKAAYTRDELNKPFVIPQIQVNMAAICETEYGRNMAIAQALGGLQQLFGVSGFGAPQAAQAAPQALPPAGNGITPHSEASAGGSAIAPDPSPVPSDEPPAIGDQADGSDDIDNTLRHEYSRRVHNLSDKALEKMLGESLEKRHAYVDWFAGLPLKEEPAATWQPSEKQVSRLYGIAKANGYDGVQLHEVISELFGGITSTKDLTREQYDQLCGDEKSNTPSWLAANPRTGGDDELPF